ncbi:MAG: DUF4491 family protein [Candidatus Cryptobacteroides sp.]
MNFSGIIVGTATFLIIGIFHPIVIKMEYYWGRQSWWLLFLAGVVFSALSLFINEVILSTIIGAIAFSCFWSIWELFQQEKRVVRGWFPENPKRHEYYQSIRNNK